MATQKQRAAAKKNVRKAISGAKAKRSIASCQPAPVRHSAGRGQRWLGASAPGASSPRTRQELYEEAKKRNLAGRSKMGRSELARALGHE